MHASVRHVEDQAHFVAERERDDESRVIEIGEV
jgi:hypothetical protein